MDLMTMFHPPPRHAAFTLIELLVVIAVIAVLAAITVPTFVTARKRPYDAANSNCHRALVNALTAYHAEHATYPADPAQLPNVTALCAAQNVVIHSTPFTGSPPTPDGHIGVRGDAYTVVTWHPRGTTILTTDKTSGKRMVNTPLTP